MEKPAVSTKEMKNVLEDIDFNSIPSSDTFQNIKVKPPRRWFNSIMALECLIIGTCIGVIIGCVIVAFGSLN